MFTIKHSHLFNLNVHRMFGDRESETFVNQIAVFAGCSKQNKRQTFFIVTCVKYSLNVLMKMFFEYSLNVRVRTSRDHARAHAWAMETLDSSKIYARYNSTIIDRISRHDFNCYSLIMIAWKSVR